MRLIRTSLTALAAVLLAIGAISLALADEPCHQYAENDSCNYGACDLTISKKCGSGSSQAECKEFYVSANITAKFTCVTVTDVGSRCIPAEDKNGNQLYTTCI